MLNQDGTLQRDGQGNPIPTYTQETVNNFARVFTGWSYCQTPGATCPNVTAGTLNFKDPMVLNPNNHDIDGENSVDLSEPRLADHHGVQRM